MITVLLLLALVAFGLVIAAAMKKAPLWTAVLILTLIALLERLPLGK